MVDEAPNGELASAWQATMKGQLGTVDIGDEVAKLLALKVTILGYYTS